ncbi:hypothetical protein [Pseudoroseicyclus sp. CXY001]|uniref:sulfotransferase family protein n=1 Tax=Pseudoroseicyclus sp. CXY001 TaxID=3242492 RepID=UPI0035713741
MRQPTSAESGAGRRALVVLGMHRSGTSMMTRLLADCGAELPQTLVGASPTNPAGHWESRRIVDLNARILETLGRHWHDWRALPEGWRARPEMAGFAEEAAALIAAEYGEAPLIVLKDPRICRLAPFWFDVLEGMGIAPLPLMLLRHPLEVGASLEERNRLPAQIGQLNWLAHVLDAEAATGEGTVRTRVLADYDSIVGGGGAEVLARMSEAFGLVWPERADPADTVDAHLRHQRADTGEPLTGRAELPVWLGPVWEVLSRWADGAPRTAEDRAVLDEARAGMAAAEPFLGAISLSAREALLFSDRVGAAEAAAARANANLAAEREERKALKAEFDAIAPEALRAAQDLRELRPRMEALSRHRDQLEEDLAGRYYEIVNFSSLLLEIEEDRRMMAERLARAEDLAERTESAERTRDEMLTQVRQAEVQRLLYARIFRALMGAGLAQKVSSAQRLKAARTALEESGVFDEAFYLSANPDVAKSGMAPIEHYLRYGLAEARPPNADLAKLS